VIRSVALAEHPDYGLLNWSETTWEIELEGVPAVADAALFEIKPDNGWRARGQLARHVHHQQPKRHVWTCIVVGPSGDTSQASNIEIPF
jgi:hypothetical protein